MKGLSRRRVFVGIAVVVAAVGITGTAFAATGSDNSPRSDVEIGTACVMWPDGTSEGC